MAPMLEHALNGPQDRNGVTTNIVKYYINTKDDILTVVQDCGHPKSFFMIDRIDFKITERQDHVEIFIAGHYCHTTRVALHGTFVGRLILPNNGSFIQRIHFLVRGRDLSNEEMLVQPTPFSLSQKDGKFSILRSTCQHHPVVSHEELEASWEGRLYLIQCRPAFALYFAWKTFKTTLSCCVKIGNKLTASIFAQPFSHPTKTNSYISKDS